MTEVTGSCLRELLEACGGDVPEAAKRIRAAATAEGRPLTISPADLKRSIYRWKRGACAPSPRYERLIRKAALAAAGSAPAGDLAGLVDRIRIRAAALPAPPELTALETAALTRLPQDDAARALELITEAKASLRTLTSGLQLLEDLFAEATGDADDRTG